MAKTTHYARASALPAIAAALALSSTPLLAQAAQPTEPAPVTTPTPTPSADPPPVSTDTSVAAPTTRDSSAAPSAEAAATTKTVRTRTTTRTARTAPARPAAAPSRPSASAATRATTARAAPPAPAAPAPVATANAPTQPAAAPVVNLGSKADSRPARPAKTGNNLLLIGGVALALIALAGIVLALVRRRRDAEAWHGEWTDEPESEAQAASTANATVEPRDAPVEAYEQPAIVEPSAFAWSPAPAAPVAEREEGDDRLPGETWVQRAYRGPSANNPSASLKNRLRRAAFFDKRERDVAAGVAEPIDADAGLPDAMADERELA